MNAENVFKLNEIEVSNYRCFTRCRLELHPNLTVLVADNGGGKTALLDAVAALLAPIVNAITGSSQSPLPGPGNVHLVRNQAGKMEQPEATNLLANATIDGLPTLWGQAVKSAKSRPRKSTGDDKHFEEVVSSYTKRVKQPETFMQSNPPPLPVIVYYGTGRLGGDPLDTVKRQLRFPKVAGRLDSYYRWFIPQSRFDEFANWYGEIVGRMKRAPVTGQQSQRRDELLIAAIREAVKCVLKPTGWDTLDWDADENQLVVEHGEHGRLPLTLLSSGIKSTITLVADIAYRCARLNPELGVESAHKSPGIVLIDEVDMHLHPSWQQRIVELLRNAFPAMQLVLTTHSPQVLSTVDKSSIRVIRNSDGIGTLETPLFQTRGVESADVLAAVMGVDPVPHVEEATQLSDYRALVEQGKADTKEAKEQYTKLVEHFGPKHPLMLDLERLARFQAIKLKRRGHEGQGAE